MGRKNNSMYMMNIIKKSHMKHVMFNLITTAILLGNETKDYYIDGQNTQLVFFEKITTEGGNWHPKLHAEGGFFGP